MISLHPLDRRDADWVAHIAVRPDQVRFAGTVGIALAEPDTVDLHTINAEGRTIGLFKIDRAYHLKHDFAGSEDLGLRGVMLDAGSQGRGLGTAAMRALADYLPPRYPAARLLYLTVNLLNPAAIAAYRKAWFRDDGKVVRGGAAGPQRVMYLDLTA